MIVTLQCMYLDRHLCQVPGNAGLMYPQTDAGPAPPTPSEPVYIDMIYPLQLFEVLGKDLQVTFDGHTVADWLWKPTKQRLSKIYPSKILPITYPAKYPRLYP